MDDLVWDPADFVLIADEQNAREALAARQGGPILLCDTDAFATAVWHARYLGEYSAEVDSRALDLRARHYLVTHPDDVPFAQDGIRDGVHVRGWMTDELVARLEATGARWHWLRGTRDQRVETALAIIDRALAPSS
jgi:HTH-type transcriptional regulator, transcriptional repressor of NAD biosynthesis genes